jgi:hypothetical protein
MATEPKATFWGDLSSEWVLLMSGGASVVVWAAGAITAVNFPTWIFFPVALVCFWIAAHRAWLKQYTRTEAQYARAEALAAERTTLEARLEQRGLTGQRAKEARRKWDGLADADRELVRQLLICGQMLTEPLQEHLLGRGFPAADLTRFERETNLIHQDASRGFWSVNVAFADPLRELAGVS